MEYKKLLIVGIDPGTTTGYAVLDIEGNLIYLNSSKQLDLKLIISKTIDFGKAVLVGTDKTKVPSLVEAFATKIGARIVSPPEDLKVDEKRKMTSNFKFSDEHQLDALASALFAYRETKSLLDKIDFFVKENKKYSIEDRIKELVITKRISIRSAVSMIEKKDEESKIIERVIVERKPTEHDFLRLYNKLKRYESEIKLMRIHNNNLKNRIIQLEKSNRSIVSGEQINKEDLENYKKIDDFRKNRIRFLENMVESKEKHLEELKMQIKKYNNMLSHINHYHILKKLDTLGLNEFNFKNKVLNIQKNDILLVDNPNIVSTGVIDFLKDKIFVIIYKKQINKKIENSMPFVFVSAENLKIYEDKYFGFIEKNQLEIEKNKVNWAKKIIEDYKREKEQLI